MSEKQIGMELQKTVKALEKAKEIAIENMAQTIGLAADAGDILLSARQEGLDIDAIQEVAGINGEMGRRFERVAKARPSLSAPAPGQLKQLALWAGILPDPIETATRRPRWLGTHTSSRQGNGSPARAQPNGHQPSDPVR
jgi:hypothetical protein